MQVSEVMHKNVQYINQDKTLKEAAEMMKSCDAGSIPVENNDKLVGMITDRDITVRAVADGLDPSKEKVKDHMTEGIKYCFESDELEEAAQSMTEQRIRRLPVMDSNKRLVGMLSTGDIVVQGKNEKLSHHTLREICH